VVSSGGTKQATSISPDGRLIMYDDDERLTPNRLPTIWVAPLATARADTTAESRVFLRENNGENQGVFRPDGHWLAYVSREGGQPEVYIAPFPGPGGRRQVSSGGTGSARPHWRRDGKELFYETGMGDIMAAEVIDHGGVLEIGKTQKLFGGLPQGAPVWTVSADGQKVLLAEQPGGEAGRPLTLVQNWPAGIRK
jgi:Tol biopolymer transport system component